MHGWESDTPEDNLYEELSSIPGTLAASALVGYRSRDLEGEKDPALAPSEPEQALVTWNSDTQELTFPIAAASGTPGLQAVFKKLSA